LNFQSLFETGDSRKPFSAAEEGQTLKGETLKRVLGQKGENFSEFSTALGFFTILSRKLQIGVEVTFDIYARIAAFRSISAAEEAKKGTFITFLFVKRKKGFKLATGCWVLTFFRGKE